MRPAQRVGLILGPALFLAMLALPAPPGLGPEGWKTAAVAVLMATWWTTDAIPIPATALLPLPLFPMLGVLGASDAAAPYANDLIFLFMGGFLIAVALERWGLHKRIALSIVHAVGTSPGRLVLGFMVATAFLSMWISNTATTAMMLPVALAVAEMLKPAGHRGEYRFGISLMLGIAYAASIGGVATLIGTPPNAVLAGAADELLGLQIGFVEWMIVGVPITIVFLPLAWFLLTRFLYRSEDLAGNAASVIAEEKSRLGPMSVGERRVGIVFVLTGLAWLLRSEKVIGLVTIPGIQTFMPAVSDSTIAMLASVILFVLPADWKRGEFVLDWSTAQKIPWGVLVLFGGGLSLARAMDQSGLAAWIGSGVAGLSEVPPIVIIAAVGALFVFLTEITSNTATSTMAMPIMAGAAVGLGMAPLALMATAALAASMAFMLPVATPPNAIVFGSGYMTIPQMVRAGLWMNLVAVVLIIAAAAWLLPLLNPT
ncbi:MAG: DASS family sodium-coupled anion symporter [Gemmatimonadota bacterium]|nr:DASS family sodium-coupled anion symporter [Gemmatimonadota bacterium]